MEAILLITKRTPQGRQLKLDGGMGPSLLEELKCETWDLCLLKACLHCRKAIEEM